MSRFSSGTYATHAVVLRTRPLGEKDRVMTLLSPERGKFSAVAKGARNPKSKLAAVSQPFVLARFLVARGRSLDITTQAETENAHVHIAGDLLKTAWATYLCELCDVVPEEQPDAALFDLLCIALQQLNEVSPGDSLAAGIIGHWFEAQFLTILGYAPTLGRCVACGEKLVVPPGDTSQRVAFSPFLGGTLCANCAARDPQRLTVLAQALRALRQLERTPAPPDVQAVPLTTAARRDLRDCLRRSLTVHLDLKLKSQKFLDEIIAAGVA